MMLVGVVLGVGLGAVVSLLVLRRCTAEAPAVVTEPDMSADARERQFLYVQTP